MEKIMLVIRMLKNWEEYMPGLIRRARHSSSVHTCHNQVFGGTG